MQPLGAALSCGSAGRYKQFPSHGPSSSAVAACTFEIPYQANLASARLYRSPGDPHALQRTTLLHFAGALDVCCTGRAIRCAIAPLCEFPALPRSRTRACFSARAGFGARLPVSACALINTVLANDVADASAVSGQISDVIVRPIVPSSLHGKPCTTKALQLGEKAIRNQSLAAGLQRVHDAIGGAPSSSTSASVAGRRLAYVWRWAVNNSDVDRMAHEMATSTFCLSPAGDNCVSARFFSAVAAGCLPVVICDHLAGGASRLPLAQPHRHAP